jgi:hypothetical protein
MRIVLFRGANVKRTLFCMVLLAITACSEQKPAAAKPTQAQVDTAIANSKLPGHQGVSGAMRVADSAAARNARLDTVGAM